MFINTPAGKFEVPKWEADRLAAMTNEEVNAAVKVGKMVDPFALTEALRRGIWRNSTNTKGTTK
jgi:hypothetical protein